MTTPLRVLIVEDSEEDAVLLVRELRRGPYEVSYERVDSPSAMSKAMAEREWDVVVCDYSMPRFPGMDALKILRAKTTELPFIFLSGTMGEEMAVEALKQGAHDYLMKDNLQRLLPAVRRELGDAELRKQRQQLEQQVQRLQKFEAIGRLAGGIAHDFNNALGVMLGWAQLGYEESLSGDRIRLQKKFQAIRDEAQRSAGLTAQLLAFARRQVLQRRTLKIDDLVAEAVNLLRTAVGAQIEFKTILGTGLYGIKADPSLIHQVLMNLCLNARDAMPEGGRLVLETQDVELGEDFCKVHTYARAGRYVLLSVSDTGVGMDAATQDRIFEPFFTTKEMGRGTGLGLATVYGIVKQHEGFLNVYSEPGQGTTFRVYFPAMAGVSILAAAPTAVSSERSGEAILLAEDHEALREQARETLEARGYHVTTSGDGAEAVRLFKANPDKIRLAILDVAMPVLSGPEAYSQMRMVKPDLPVIFISGHTAELPSLYSLIEGGAGFLQKPYAPQDLLRFVRATLARQAVQEHNDDRQENTG
jgi:signal transduction histidine kinase